MFIINYNEFLTANTTHPLVALQPVSLPGNDYLRAAEQLRERGGDALPEAEGAAAVWAAGAGARGGHQGEAAEGWEGAAKG